MPLFHILASGLATEPVLRFLELEYLLVRREEFVALK